MRREEREALKELIEERVERKREEAIDEAKRKEAKEYWEKEDKRKKDILCSFCSENSDDVLCMIAGPNDINICSNCVQLCNEILEERISKKS